MKTQRTGMANLQSTAGVAYGNIGQRVSDPWPEGNAATELETGQEQVTIAGGRSPGRGSRLRRTTLMGIALAGCLLESVARAQTPIPATYVMPLGAADTSRPGFVWRIHQVTTPQPNSNVRTEQQLAGLLGDNIADPNALGAALAAASPAGFSTAPIAFNIGTVINLSRDGAENAGNFAPDNPFPGLPGLTGSSENVAAEILTWLDLPAGEITLGVNSDDGFEMTLGGVSPFDRISGTKVGAFDGGRGAADTIFSITVAQAGLYAARCTWEQGIGGANIEIFSVNPDGTRVLVNDTANGGIPAYSGVTAPRAYVRSIAPLPGTLRAPASGPVVVELAEGASAINSSGITLSINGANVVPTTTKSGSVWTISYTPTPPFASGSQQNVVLSYMDGSLPVSDAWSFHVAWVTSGGQFAADFDSGQPPGTMLFGSAHVDASGGVGNSGVLKLTDAYVYGSSGWLSVEDFNGGGPVAAFHATFKLLIGGGEGADGFSFNFANDVADPPDGAAEEGTGSGLSIMFDTFDNGGGEAPAIDAKYGGSLLGSAHGDPSLFRTGDFVDVDITLAEQGTLDLTVNGVVVCTGLPVPFIPKTGRFVLGARTGGSTDNHWIDNLEITATPPSAPYVASFVPAGANIRWDALIQIVLQDAAAAQLKPSSVKLTINGASVVPAVSKSGGTTTVSYQPSRLPPGDNVVTLDYSDTAGHNRSVTRHFNVMQYLGPTGNYYETVLVPNFINWPAAQVAAEQRTFFGHHGHLATITSYEEDLYLEFLRRDSGVQDDGQLWVGGYQIPGSFEPSEGWMWVNNEGPFPGYNYGSTYANWQYYPYFQPDNAWADSGGENYLAIGLSGIFGWNDDGYYANGRRNGTLSGYVVEYEAVSTVAIDIKPGDSQNPIQLSSNGKIPVAILSSSSFDASTVDPATVRFGETGTEAAPVSYSLSDVDGDKRKDLVCTFNTQDTGFICADKVGKLTATLRDGLFRIKGSDSIHPLNCPQFGLSLVGLQDVNNLTDVYLTVGVLAQNVVPPTVAQHVQFKSLDLMGKVRWTKNLQSLTLFPTPTNTSAGVVQFTDLKHMEPLKVQMEVPTSGAGNSTLVLRSNGVVLFRPDLAVTGVQGPGSAPAGLPVNIPVNIAELQGDLGATANLYLLEGQTLLDWRQGVGLGPRETGTVVFSLSLSQMGTHELRVVISEVTPGDYDPSNNQMTFHLEVTQPSTYYYAEYHRAQQEYAYAYGYDQWWYYTNLFNGSQESLYASASTAIAWTYPLNSVTVQLWADGAEKFSLVLPDVAPDYVYRDGGYTQQSLARELSPGFNLYITSSLWSGGYQYSYATLQKFAGDYVYYSAYHDLYWGYVSEYGDTVKLGDFVNALNSLDIRLAIQSAGLTYGGTFNVPLYSYSWDYPPFDYRYPDGYFSLLTVDRGTRSDGYASGIINP